MKVRIGIGTIPVDHSATEPALGLADLIDELEAHRIDSVWLPDSASTPVNPDPLIGMAYAAGRTQHLKLGCGVLILPGRNPALVAKQLASLAALAPKRILPVFGIRPARPAERPLFPVPDGRRARVFDEAIAVVRALLTEPAVTYHGEFFRLEEVSIAPLPSKPLDLWLGGRAPIALRRVGRLADGWLGSFVTPHEAGECRARIKRAADEAEREIEEDHYGTNILVAPDDAADAAVAEALATVRARRPDIDPEQLVCRGWAEAKEHIQRFVDVGLTKFVVRPAVPVASRREFLDQFVTQLQPLET